MTEILATYSNVSLVVLAILQYSLLTHLNITKRTAVILYTLPF